jgi:hypothetical protein
MNRGRATAETIHLTALGLWLGALVMAGAAAAIIFPTMKALKPQLPDYSGYTGDHWMIAAGQPAAKIFLAADIVQFVCATLAIITAGVLLFVSHISLRRPSALVRVLALVAAIGLLGFHSIYLAPRMQLNMRGHWEAAIQGNNTEAAKFKDVFAADHPLASRLMGATAIAVLISLAAGAWSATTSGVAPPAERAPRPSASPSRYEEPALLKGRR